MESSEKVVNKHWIASAVACLVFLQNSQQVSAQEIAKGVVYNDVNQNGQRDAGEQGIGQVAVSNGVQVVLTDDQGQYELPVSNDTPLFVIKPRNWMTPVDENQLPRFFYMHKPEGSPEVHFKGIAPTGPLPESVDFGLIAREEADEFKVLFFGDTQSRNETEVAYMAHDVLAPIIAKKAHQADFGVILGDIVFDNLSVFTPTIESVAQVGIPWYNVLGNHDMNYDAQDDQFSDETFERHYGPSWYAYNHGPVHFIVLNDVKWIPAQEGKKGHYVGALGDDQIEFVKNSIAHVPEDSLIVLMMHIPLPAVQDRENLYRVIESRPHTLSLSAHSHIQHSFFLGEEQGWKGATPHHHLNHGTVCGSWWAGVPDEFGIPHATMADGTPNGYSVCTFKGNQYEFVYRVPNRPESYQMNLYAPDAVQQSDLSQTEVFANVFSGTIKSTVEMKVGEQGTWIELAQTLSADPYVQKVKDLETADGKNLRGRKTPKVGRSTHLWKGNLPADLTPGWHTIQVRTTDMYGKTYHGYRLIQVKP